MHCAPQFSRPPAGRRSEQDAAMKRHEKAAARLVEQRLSLSPIEPLPTGWRPRDEPDGYRVQQAVNRMLTDSGLGMTHDEMVEKLRAQSAESEGRLAMAVESVDMKSIELEERARKLEGQEILKQFKIDLGMADKSGGQDAGKTEEKKTIGPEKTKVE